MNTSTVATIAQMAARLCGLLQIVLGVLFWTGRGLNLVPLHISVGLVLTLALLTLAVLGKRAGAPPGFVAFSLAWVILMPAFGLTQSQILAGDLHWLVQVLHLLVGLGAVGQCEGLARFARRPAAAAGA